MRKKLTEGMNLYHWLGVFMALCVFVFAAVGYMHKVPALETSIQANKVLIQEAERSTEQKIKELRDEIQEDLEYLRDRTDQIFNYLLSEDDQ